MGGGGGGYRSCTVEEGPEGSHQYLFICKCILQGGGGVKGGEICRKDKRVKMVGEKGVKCKSNWELDTS